MKKKQRCDFWSSNKCIGGETQKVLNRQWGKLRETMMFCLVVVVVVVDR